MASVVERATQPVPAVLADLETSPDGLTAATAAARLAATGPNAVTSHRARALSVLWHQVRSPLLGLLVAAAAVSFVVGERTDALIIWAIVALSVGLGFANEYRAERAAQALHSQITHTALVRRDGQPIAVPVTELVPGDVIALKLGDIVPADLRLTHCDSLACDESVLTGESMPASKQCEPVAAGAALADLTSCALMGTVVHEGAGQGVVIATGRSTAFGAVAAGLGGAPIETEFQVGLRRFSLLLVYVAGSLTSAIFVLNLIFHKPLFDALLFSLAIAVGITPQLLPAVVSTSLAAGSRQLARRRVLVKRLVSIEDLGDVDLLFTDKTGTLTQGRVTLMRALPVADTTAESLLTLARLCTDTGNALDQALRDSPLTASASSSPPPTLLAELPFDHERRLASVLVAAAPSAGSPSATSTGSAPSTGPLLITKGAPEAVLPRCVDVPAAARAALDAEFAAGNRVVAVATRPVPTIASRAPAAAPTPAAALTPADECDLQLVGFLVFLDPPRPDAADALQRLADLGVTVKIVTGDNPVVAVKVCHDLGLADATALTGPELDGLSDAALAEAIARTTVFARVSPEQKARIVAVQRHAGRAVAFLGDGVNDALALHAADVGISVDSATDVAKDAADVILLDKSLAVLADGIMGGRRIFANTIKYVLMGTSSNFGNMFSAAGASVFLSFLPMLPAQILLNNLLYDSSQLAIPTDHVDPEQLRRPTHWDIGFIRRFMLVFGPLSSLFDFATFALLLWVFHASVEQFRSGWFVESLATQTLIIFAIRTRRVPFTRSRPGLAIALAAVGVVVLGAVLPATPLAGPLGFHALSLGYYGAIVGLVVAYLVLVEIAKRLFYRRVSLERPPSVGRAGLGRLGRLLRRIPDPVPRHLRRRAHRFSA